MAETHLRRPRKDATPTLVSDDGVWLYLDRHGDWWASPCEDAWFPVISATVTVGRYRTTVEALHIDTTGYEAVYVRDDG